MAESMRGLKRSHRCTEVSSADIGSTVTVMGWVQRRRNLGSLIFIDLRDRSGLLQIVFDENSVGSDGFAKAETLRSEYVIAVVGKIQKRSAAVNENLKTGDIEVIAESLRILSESDTPPFHIEENSQTKDEIRLKYRYLDLRRPDLQRNLMLRSKVAYLMRDFMAKEGFMPLSHSSRLLPAAVPPLSPGFSPKTGTDASVLFSWSGRYSGYHPAQNEPAVCCAGNDDTR